MPHKQRTLDEISERSLDFKRMGQRLMERDRADLLETLVMPLFDVHTGKTFPLGRIEDLLLVTPEKAEAAESVSEGEEQSYIYEDEIEDARIQKNYILLFENLLKTLQQKETISLHEWQEQLKMQLGEQVVRNGDYYSFLVHLAQKKEYKVTQIIAKPDTFLEEAVKVFLEEHKEYEDMEITLVMLPEEELPEEELPEEELPEEELPEEELPEEELPEEELPEEELLEELLLEELEELLEEEPLLEEELEEELSEE